MIKGLGGVVGHNPQQQDELALIAELVNQSLELWDIPPSAAAKLINVSENATFLVEGRSYKSVLRVHRPGYHSRRAIECELAWSTALNASGGVPTPGVLPGKNGQNVQSAWVEGLTDLRYMVLFEYVAGEQPNEQDDLTGPFEELGRIAARTHLHSITWDRPQPFERLVWDTDAIFGAKANWGNWRDAPNMTPAYLAILDEVEAVVTSRLEAFGRAHECYGLIHADMRLANLLIEGGRTRLIDFDDCGLGWFLYDFAAAVSFIEDHAQVPALQDAWVRGYREVRHLSVEDEAEMDSFIMLRRMALLAWIGSHMEAPEPQMLAPHFARITAELGSKFLANKYG